METNRIAKSPTGGTRAWKYCAGLRPRLIRRMSDIAHLSVMIVRPGFFFSTVVEGGDQSEYRSE